MENLVNKYQAELTDIKKPMWKQYAEALENTINYIKSYDELDDNLRIPCAYVAKQIHLNNDNFNMEDIKQTINEFLDYYQKEYQKYIDSLVLITDQYCADIIFYDRYVKKHQQ